MVKVLTDYYTITHHASWFSLATLFCILTFVSTLLGPFFLAFSGERMWTGPKIIYEQPDVSIDSSIMVRTYDGSSFQTFSVDNRFNGEEISSRVPIIKTMEEDLNQDGLTDKVKVEVTVMGNPENVRNIKVGLPFKYSFSDIQEYKTKMMAFISIDTPNGASQVNTFGTLNLSQRTPFRANAKNETETNYDYIENMLRKKPSLTLLDIEREMTSRNETLNYDHTSMVIPRGNQYSTKIKMAIDIPEYQSILYIPSLEESAKFNLLSYVSFLLPAYYLFFGVLSVAVASNIVKTTSFDTLPVKKVNIY